MKILATAKVPVKALAPCVVELGTGFTLFPGAIYKEPRQIQLLQLLLMWHCENAGKSNSVKAFAPCVAQGTVYILFLCVTYKDPRQVQPL